MNIAERQERLQGAEMVVAEEGAYSDVCNRFCNYH